MAARTCLSLLLLVSTLGAGCTATSNYMRPLAATASPKAPDGKALVIFARPSGFARGMVFTIIDDQGNFVGDSQAYSVFGVPVDGGRHLFISWAENSAAVQVTTEPGKVYWVHVSPRIGAWIARAQLLVVKPGTDKWNERPEWLRDLQHLEVDRTAGQAYLDGKKEDTLDRVRRGVETFAEYNDEERAERVLKPEDGEPGL